MILRTMTATFGGLKNETLALSPGLNLIEAPNEGGKSTWCAFLRAMFYGLESKKGRELSERNRYTPWSGAAMSGVIDLTWRGKDITLRRFPKGTNPFGGFEAVYTGTREPVPGLTADNVGEMILGVTKEVFERTAFIPQGGMTVGQSGDLEARIAGLVTAGDETVSFSRTEKTLRDWRNQRQSNRTHGAIPKLRDRLDEVTAQKDRILQVRRQMEDAQQAIETYQQEKERLADDLLLHEALRSAAQRERYDKAKEDLAAAEDAAARARAELDAPMPPREAPKKEPLRGLIPAILIFALEAVLLVLGLLHIIPNPAIIALPVLACGAVILIKGALDARARAAQALQVQADKEAAILAQRESALREAETNLAAAQKVWDAVSAQGEPVPLPAAGRPPLRSYEEDQRLYRAADRNLAFQQDLLAQAKGREQELGGYALLSQEEAALTEALAQQEEDYAALDLALAGLTAANAQLQTRFSPAVSRSAGEYLSALTGGKYDTLSFSRDFEASAQTDEGLRAAWFLSRGTADQVYLALRLAICKLALPADEPAPIVLDDAFVAFDDRRLALALQTIEDLADTRQILLFTCQSREGMLLKGN